MSQKKDKNKILFFRESVFEVSKLIFDYPNKTFHIRMLEKETGFSTTAVVDSINELKKYGIVQMEETPLTTNVKADLESEAYRFYKLIFNLYRIKRYLFIDGLVEKLNNPESIVLFGSFSKGEDAEQSDIDILVISHNKPDERLQDFVDICNYLKRAVAIYLKFACLNRVWWHLCVERAGRWRRYDVTYLLSQTIRIVVGRRRKLRRCQRLGQRIIKNGNRVNAPQASLA